MSLKLYTITIYDKEKKQDIQVPDCEIRKRFELVYFSYIMISDFGLLLSAYRDLNRWHILADSYMGALELDKGILTGMFKLLHFASLAALNNELRENGIKTSCFKLLSITNHVTNGFLLDKENKDEFVQKMKGFWYTKQRDYGLMVSKRLQSPDFKKEELSESGLSIVDSNTINTVKKEEENGSIVFDAKNVPLGNQEELLAEAIGSLKLSNNTQSVIPPVFVAGAVEEKKADTDTPMSLGNVHKAAREAFGVNDY